jgi:hypothetical protein
MRPSVRQRARAAIDLPGRCQHKAGARRGATQRLEQPQRRCRVDREIVERCLHARHVPGLRGEMEHGVDLAQAGFQRRVVHGPQIGIDRDEPLAEPGEIGGVGAAIRKRRIHRRYPGAERRQRMDQVRAKKTGAARDQNAASMPGRGERVTSH